jgi:UDPglucose--hexose-1-phosphate uridylyltransferase
MVDTFSHRSLRQHSPMTEPFPQLRKDPIVDRWVFIAPERAARPTELEDAGHLAHHASCVFCEGREAETPPEVHALRSADSAPNGPGWRVRVVPNLFPAVRRGGGSGYGAHEVVIECPQHEASLAALSNEQIRDVFRVYRDRLAALRADPRLAYVQVFKNHGAAAGASIEHAHSQILAGAEIPREVRAELAGSNEYHQRNGRCLFCDLLDRESAAGHRVILASEQVVAVAAWAGRFPYETWVLPRQHGAHFDWIGDAELTDLAATTGAVLRRLRSATGDQAYNILLHTAPAGDTASHYHWHWEILPRTTGIAGYELATGCYLNPLPPEEAARQLRIV